MKINGIWAPSLEFDTSAAAKLNEAKLLKIKK